MFVSLQNVPKNLDNLRKYENLQMRISTKPCYKLLKSIYDDRISPKYPRKHRKFAKMWKPETANVRKNGKKLKLRKTTKQCYELLKRIYDDRISPKCRRKLARKFAKNQNLKIQIFTKPYQLFSVAHNYFLLMFLIIKSIYDDRIPQKCPKKLRQFAKIWKSTNANIY